MDPAPGGGIELEGVIAGDDEQVIIYDRGQALEGLEGADHDHHDAGEYGKSPCPAASAGRRLDLLLVHRPRCGRLDSSLVRHEGLLGLFCVARLATAADEVVRGTSRQQAVPPLPAPRTTPSRLSAGARVYPAVSRRAPAPRAPCAPDG